MMLRAPCRVSQRTTPVRNRSWLARGFTLIEVMLATLLLSMLLAGTYGAVRTAVKAMKSGEAAIDRTNRVRVTQEFLRHQISRIIPLAFDRDDGTGANFVFEGKRDFMRFVAPMPGYLSRGGAYVQTLELVHESGGEKLQFSDTMLNGFDPKKEKKADREPVVLINQIRSGRFEYRAFDEDGKLGDWTDKWKDKTLTPVMVRLRLEMSADAHIEFPEMEIPLVLDVGSMRRPFAGPQPIDANAALPQRNPSTAATAKGNPSQ